MFDSSVWPPAPRNFNPIDLRQGKKRADPRDTFSFFFGRFIVYGIGFGLCYGGGLGLLIFIIGAAYGAPIGILLGLALGLFNGIVLGARAALLIHKGVSAADAAKNVRILTPFSSAVGGAVIAAILFSAGMLGVVFDWFIMGFTGVVWLIAIGAAWHAATIFTRKFAQEYA